MTVRMEAIAISKMWQSIPANVFRKYLSPAVKLSQQCRISMAFCYFRTGTIYVNKARGGSFRREAVRHYALGIVASTVGENSVVRIERC